jgi:site-specific DNA recombinase
MRDLIINDLASKGHLKNKVNKNMEDLIIKSLRVAIYARVSTEEQAELGYSIQGQVEVIRKKCLQEDLIVVDEYVDSGISGKSMEGRLALQRLLKDVKENKFDIVYVWKISRLARKNVDLLTIVEDLEKNNIKLKSITENFDTSNNMGKFSLSMMGAVAEFERNTIIENVKLGMAQKARMGNWNGGIVLGYQSVNQNNGKDKHLVVVPEEAVIVKRIFELYFQGKGLRAIANEMNSNGYRTKRNNTFSTAAIKEIVTNPLYVGLVRFNRYENWSDKRRKGKSQDVIFTNGNHEAIISKNLWNQVQLIHKSKSFSPVRNFEGSFPLVGLMKCPRCGASMVANRTVNKLKDGTKKNIRYYSCGAFRSKGSSVCNANSIRAEYAEKYIFSRLQEVVEKPSILRKIVDQINLKRIESIDPLKEEVLLVENRLKELEKISKKYFNLFEKNLMDHQAVLERLTEIREEKESLFRRKEEINLELQEGVTSKLDFQFVKQILGQLNKVLKVASNEQIKTLLHLFVKSIKINKRKIESVELFFSDQFFQEIMKEVPSDISSDGTSFYLCL